MQIDAEGTVDAREFINAVWNAISKLYGEYGASQTNLALIDYSHEKGFAVIRVGHSAVDMVRTSVATITKIGNVPSAIHILKVSGTIKSLYNKTRSY